MLLCAIGLLLSVAMVPAFGYDVANDVVGFGLVAVGAARSTTRSATGRSLWWTITAGGAVLAAVVRLFTYGGPASTLTEHSFSLWSWAAHLSLATEGLVVTGLLLAIWHEGQRVRGPWLPTMAVGFAVATAGQLALDVSGLGFYGPTALLHQALAVVLGMVSLATVVLAFLRKGPLPAGSDPSEP